MTTKTNERAATKVITGTVRFSYLHVWEPSAIEEGAPKKYSASLIIPKSDTETLRRVKAAVSAAFDAGVQSKFNGKRPSRWKDPLRDGDDERAGDEAYKDCYFLNASSSTKPGIVDRDCNPILDQTELYSGCYGRASVNFYAFNKAGNIGVACGLNNLQKLTDGEPLGGRETAESDFGALGVPDDYYGAF